ncbi:MAG: hypothetical protein IPG50_24980 [Myxococcales bacterium]|nr:hypothetical protein [Myxococcales bacterium]
MDILSLRDDSRDAASQAETAEAASPEASVSHEAAVDASVADGASDAPVDACANKDLASDPAHCGACFRSCLGGACTNGACSAVLVATATSPAGVAVDSQRVYFAEATTSGAVYSVRKDGGDKRQLVAGLASPQRLAVDDSYVFYTTVGVPGIVGRVDKDGANALVLTRTNASPGSLLRDGTDVLFVDLYSATIRKVPVLGLSDAGLAPALASAGNYPWGISTAGGEVVWSARGTLVTGDAGPPGFTAADGVLYGAPKDGSGSRRTIVADQREPLGVAADASGIYWVTGVGGEVIKLAAGAATPAPLVSNQPSPWGIALDATHVYFTCFGGAAGKGIVARVRKDGTSTTAEVLVSELAFPSTLALDEDAVYWTNTHGGSVMKVAK